MTINFKALARYLQSGGLDANGQTPEVSVSDGMGNPCRHCLSDIPKDEKMLILAFRPFPAPQPYAELGPIFLCAERCEPYAEVAKLPDLYHLREAVLLRGYRADDRIMYGTGKVTAVAEIEAVAEQLFENADVKYIHMRSSTNNCYQCRIERG